MSTPERSSQPHPQRKRAASSPWLFPMLLGACRIAPAELGEAIGDL